MLSDPSLIAAQRPERDLAGRWGIYSVQQDQWMDVVFATEHEAMESLMVLRTCKPKCSSDRTSADRRRGVF